MALPVTPHDATLPPTAADGKSATTATFASPASRASLTRSPATAITTQGRRWRSAELFGPAQEVEIEHGQAVYRLRRTSLGKLILTK